MASTPCTTNKRIIAVNQAPTGSYFTVTSGSTSTQYPVYYFAFFEDGTTLPYLTTDQGMQLNSIGQTSTDKFAINNSATNTVSSATGTSGTSTSPVAVVKSWFSS